jgi:hypothetical protein
MATGATQTPTTPREHVVNMSARHLYVLTNGKWTGNILLNTPFWRAHTKELYTKMDRHLSCKTRVGVLATNEIYGSAEAVEAAYQQRGEKL